MAIPNRTTITCPQCGTTEDVVIGDTSVGPQGRVSDTPIYSLLPSPLWTQTRRDAETHLTCTTCGNADFVTLTQQVKQPLGTRPVKPKPRATS